LEGKPFWLAFQGGTICQIYDCCINQKALAHCGLCPEVMCERYLLEDPTKTPEENAENRRKQLLQLKSMRKA
jgi:hypothetical protein